MRARKNSWASFCLCFVNSGEISKSCSYQFVLLVNFIHEEDYYCVPANAVMIGVGEIVRDGLEYL